MEKEERKGRRQSGLPAIDGHDRRWWFKPERERVRKRDRVCARESECER